MDEVAGGLFVGTVEDAGDEGPIREHNIASIVSLSHSEPDGGFPSDLTVKNAPVIGGPPNDQQRFDRAVTHVVSSIKTENNTLVHCSVGASGSPAVAATAFALYEHVKLEAPFEQFSQRQNAVDHVKH